MKHFFNVYHHGFIRAAVCVPEVKVADPVFNTKKTIELARKAAKQNALLAIFPEMGLSAYSNDDLFHQDALLKGVREAVAALKKASATINTILAAEAGVNCRAS